MSLPSTGRISLGNVQSEFGGSNPIRLSEYYAGGSYVVVGTSGTSGSIPSTGSISLGRFRGSATSISPGTYSISVTPTSVPAAGSLTFTVSSVIGSQNLFYTVEERDIIDLGISVDPVVAEVGQSATFSWFTSNATNVVYRIGSITDTPVAIPLNGTITTPTFSAANIGIANVFVTASNTALSSSNIVTKIASISVVPSTAITTTTTTLAPIKTGTGYLVNPSTTYTNLIGVPLPDDPVYLMFRMLGAAGGGGGGDRSSIGGSGGGGHLIIGTVLLPAGTKVLRGGVGAGGGRAGSSDRLLESSVQNGLGGTGYSWPQLSAATAGAGGAGAPAGTRNRSGSGGGGGGGTILGFTLNGIEIPIAAAAGGGGGGGGSDYVAAGGGAGRIGLTTIGNVRTLVTAVGSSATRLTNDGGGGGGGGGGAGEAGTGGTDRTSGGTGGSAGQSLQNISVVLNRGSYADFTVYRPAGDPSLVTDPAARDSDYFGRGGRGGLQYIVSDSGSGGAIAVYWTSNVAVAPNNYNLVPNFPAPDLTVLLNGTNITVSTIDSTAYLNIYRNGTYETNNNLSRVDWINLPSTYVGNFYEIYLSTSNVTGGATVETLGGTLNTWTALSAYSSTNPIYVRLLSGSITYSATVVVTLRKIGTTTEYESRFTLETSSSI